MDHPGRHPFRMVSYLSANKEFSLERPSWSIDKLQLFDTFLKHGTETLHTGIANGGQSHRQLLGLTRQHKESLDWPVLLATP